MSADLPPLDEIGRMPGATPPPRAVDYPKGWSPCVVEAANVAEATTEAEVDDGTRRDERDLIAQMGLDPDVWRIIDGSLLVNRWQGMTGPKHDPPNELVWLRQFKFRVQRVDPLVHADVGDLIRLVRSRRKRPKPTSPPDGLTFLLCIGDTQIGKADGDGSAGTVRRWHGSLERQLDRLAALRKRYPIARLVTAYMGDLGEGCKDNYPGQKFTADLTMREQDGVLQELVYDTLDATVSTGVDVQDVLTAPGNHGEERDGGKAYTLPSDNRDIAVVETVHRGTVRNDNPRYSHVRWHYPQDEELTVLADLSGVRVLFSHGHQWKKGATPVDKFERWWRDMEFDERFQARLAVGGHYHHHYIRQTGVKTLFGCPALDGGSQWWQNLGGGCSPPGMLSMLVGDRVGPAECGWTEAVVL